MTSELLTKLIYSKPCCFTLETREADALGFYPAETANWTVIRVTEVEICKILEKIDRWAHARCLQATSVSESAAVGFVKNSVVFQPVKYKIWLNEDSC